MKRSIVCLALAVAASSCASIVSKINYPVSVRSEPDAAAFVIRDEDGNEVHRGVTPATVTLAAGSSYFDKEHYEIVFTRDGMPSRTVHLDAKLDPWYFGNILFGGLIGMLIVDPLTGAMFKLDDAVVGRLAPVAP